jgi:hypothetical protein
MFKFIYQYHFIIIIVLSFFIGNFLLYNAQAAGVVPCEGLDCNFCDLFQLFKNVFDAVLEITLAIATGFIVYGGILIMFSGTNSGWLAKGRKTVLHAVVGVAIALGAWLIVDTILKFLAGGNVISNDWGPWNNLNCY